MTGLEELTKLHLTLGNLLRNQEPGLMTWRIMLHDTLMEMACLAGEGARLRVSRRPKHSGQLLICCKDGLATIDRLRRGIRSDGADMHTMQSMRNAIAEAEMEENKDHCYRIKMSGGEGGKHIAEVVRNDGAVMAEFYSALYGVARQQAEYYCEREGIDL